MSDNIVKEDTEIVTNEKKKQKAGLNGVRPDDYVEVGVAPTFLRITPTATKKVFQFKEYQRSNICLVLK